ncbi:NmrA family transcriptional regulator [Nonomuraea longispora]|uniref:NmrA family transcriptional regulator n=1 Tax=Nonomuraea longispora TaxID=1848320 RepID=A0A4R4NSQ9_9ACTN|nr:NAD(P)H-binding protein [Nonomuraea longispora]TDC11033.1 NmrA family transcriptional regulator [Nonomuraea longispora]
MILVTGGRGAVATQLLTLLQRAGHPVRVASSNPGELHVPEGAAAVTCNLRNPVTFPAALCGVSEVFLYAEASHIAEFIDAAATAGVEHVVLLSSAGVLEPNAADDPLAKSHLDVETALLSSPLTTTFLRPGSFAANAGAWAWPIKAGRPVSLPYPGSYTDPIDERDIAEAAFTVLTDPRHQGRHLHLTGPQTLTFSEQIDQLSETIGRSIIVNHVTREAWKQEMAHYIPGPYADALLDCWHAYDGRPVPLTDTVEQVTGHPARTFATWARDHASDFVE